MHLERFKTLANIRKAKLEIVPFIKDKEKLFLPSKNHQFINFRKTVIKIARQLNISPKVAEKQLRSFTPPAHRLTVKKISRNLIILDDTYNSNPLGFKKALKTLKSYPKYQKIVVTPGMIELGKKQFSLNKEVAKEAAAVADIFVGVGETNKRALRIGAGEVKKKNLRIIYLEKDKGLDEGLTAYLKPPTVILLENELPDHYF
jgi:UDP-N-acetylmuramoyl-tripeptide--D-alanyl-D-alanine ligase